MDIKPNIKQKSQDLIRKAKVLPSIAIKWEKPIYIKCTTLKNANDLRAKGILVPLENNKTLPAIYYFSVKSKHSGDSIVEALKLFKDSGQRSCPKIDKNRDKRSRYLYCGSRKEGLHGRFIQHLGFGSENTFALQLFHWAKEIGLDVEFHYAWLNKEQRDFTELLESALAAKIVPLVGKLA